ncbi:MAG: phosphatase PAP2 family protein [Calditrichaeota bacterium]|nr:phosphatase PAP2 family protein [Calditrichota bacterium]
MIKIVLGILIISQLISGKLNAQDIDRYNPHDRTSVFFQDARHFVEVGFGLISAPFMFDLHDWTGLATTLGGTALLFTTDKSVRSFTHRNQNKLNNTIFDLDAYYGDSYTGLFALSLYGYGALAGNEHVRRTGLYATEAIIYAGSLTGTLKLIIGRRRPYAGNGHLFFNPFQFGKEEYRSLPSGHTTVSFAVSTVLAKSVDNTYWKIFWYGAAGLVGASRIYHNKHWLSDVFLGAAIGYTVGDYVSDFDLKERPSLFGVKIKPYFGLNRIGLQANF